MYAPGGQAAFSDGFAFLLASHKSLAALNNRISKPVTMENFRPNIVADSFTAYAEDNWESIVFESSPFISMKIVKPCARCKVPTIDPLTGIFDPNNEPTRTIKKFRSGKALGFRNEAWNGEVYKQLKSTYFCCSLCIVDLPLNILQVGTLVSLVLFSEISIDNACDKLQLLIADRVQNFSNPFILNHYLIDYSTGILWSKS